MRPTRLQSLVFLIGRPSPLFPRYAPRKQRARVAFRQILFDITPGFRNAADNSPVVVQAFRIHRIAAVGLRYECVPFSGLV